MYRTAKANHESACRYLFAFRPDDDDDDDDDDDSILPYSIGLDDHSPFARSLADFTFD